MKRIILILLLLVSCTSRIPNQQSRTGLTPPEIVIEQDSLQNTITKTDGDIVLDVTPYLWRYGCGPTSLAMVLGYYGLIIGNVEQTIASEGNIEDYVNPIDTYPNLLVDDYIEDERIPHIDNSIADLMNTSRSTKNNFYGYSWSSDLGLAFIKYVNPIYKPSYKQYYILNGTLTWNLLVNEINNKRPMIFMVDTDADGYADHFITVIGYRTNPKQYASYDTWSTKIRWLDFIAVSKDTLWGIWSGWTFNLNKVIFLPIIQSSKEERIYP